jgi:Zn-dependent membrane protease YugP
MPFDFYAFDSYYGSYLIYILPAMVLALLAQINVQSTFNRYSRKLSSRALTGAQTARMILDRNGLQGVRVERVPGKLSDHYDPRENVIKLSEPVFGNTSVASIGVAAHETGHAVQHSTGYFPIRVRNAIIPVTQIGSSVSIWLILIGIFLSMSQFVLIGIIFFSFAVLFQLVTLPVEYNASSRALKTLSESGMLFGEELQGAKKVLRAASLTYVAATAVAFLQLLRLLSIFGRMRR